MSFLPFLQVTADCSRPKEGKEGKKGRLNHIVDKLSRILVAVDFSEPARAAFEHALLLARIYGARVIAVHAVPPSEPFDWAAQARTELFGRLRQQAEAAGVPFTASVQHGDPAGVIVLHARARHADVIVLGAHRRTTVERLRGGSVSERVLADAPQPVLIVPSGAAIRRTRTLTNVVVAADLSDAAAAVIEQGIAIARRAKGRATLVHVVPGSPDVPRYLYRYGAAEYRDAVTADAWQRLQQLVRPGAKRDVAIDARVVVGDPYTEIARVAREVDADLIVTGASRRGVLSRAVFGSTTMRLMRAADRPLLVVPEFAMHATMSDRAAAQQRAA